MPNFQREFLEIKRLEHLQAHPEYIKLEQRLLSMGGVMVVPRQEPDQDKILSRGRLWNGDNVRFIRGHPNTCHGNVAMLWWRNPMRYRIATGWALSDDGLWRQHSWIIERGNVVETTKRVPRKKAPRAPADLSRVLEAGAETSVDGRDDGRPQAGTRPGQDPLPRKAMERG